MNPLLEQFITEAREFLQGIGESLMALESEPESKELMGRLFRLVHTLKGNSSLFTLPPMTRVLHAAEDLMDGVRDGKVPFSRELADQLLEAMDFVSHLTDELEANGSLQSDHAGPADHCSHALRRFLTQADDNATAPTEIGTATPAAGDVADTEAGLIETLSRIPETARLAAWEIACTGTPLLLVIYHPADDCFYKGEDPFFQARNTPGLIWGTVQERCNWPDLTGFDCYACNVDFYVLTGSDREEISEFFRYNPDEVQIVSVAPEQLVHFADTYSEQPLAIQNANALRKHFGQRNPVALAAAIQDALHAADSTSTQASALRWLASVTTTRPELTQLQAKLITFLTGQETPLPDSQPQSQPSAPDEAEQACIQALLRTQHDILALPDDVKWLDGRIRAAAGVIRSMLLRLGQNASDIDSTLAQAIAQHSARPLHDWLTSFLATGHTVQAPAAPEQPLVATKAAPSTDSSPLERDQNFGRRAEDALGGKVLKVDQAKVDRLMSLIGEMVVAKNSLPYLANRAEEQYGVRELAREIKAQYAVINRIAEEMQDAIMQVRMLPVSFIFQRFPRLVRDISRKLGKEVELRLEGEETEADKHIIESLADPLIHIVRNSLDHGLESPEARIAAGKPRNGRLTIRAHQESDRVFIEIEDDGRGIDPEIIKRKAYEKGLIDEGQLERLTDKEAIHLIFRAGFSTAETVTDLSGRGVGMDVVRNALDKVGGSVDLSSQVGRGTCLRLSLPLSMAVTNVMIIESDAQIFGVPMDMVVETVRLPRSSIQTIKRRLTTVLRGRIIPLVSLNEQLGIAAEPVPNADDELAALIVKVGGEQIGLLIDDFRETVDVILKPLPGALARLPTYAGSALLGDGSVLMVINPKELFQ